MWWLFIRTCAVLSQLPIATSDNPTAIVQPYAGPDPGYILAESDGGLSNRLRVLAAYMFIAESKFDGAHLIFVWDVNEACPGHFLQIFEPVPHVVFATNSSRYVVDKRAKIVYENSWAVFAWTLSMNNIPKSKFGQPSWTQIEYNMYSRYAPTREVMNKVKKFVKTHNICQASAMHLRMTDLSQHLAKKHKVVNINSYFEFVDSRPKDEPVYILTDNPDSQKMFLDKYGPQKILVYSVIPPKEQQELVVLNTYHATNATGDARRQLLGKRAGAGAGAGAGGGGGGGQADVSGGKSRLPDDHRFTSIEHTLIDVLIAAHARTFKPGIYSSLSDLVHMFARIGKKDRGWCS